MDTAGDRNARTPLNLLSLIPEAANFAAPFTSTSPTMIDNMAT